MGSEILNEIVGRGPLVVGTLHDAVGMRLVRRRRPRVDLCEVRADALPVPPSAGDIGGLGLPAIVTVRDPAEGGARALPLELRRELYLELLPAAAAIDIEVRNLRGMQEVVEAARQQGCAVIASYHDFGGVPTLARLRAVAGRARDAGVDCVKVAALVDTRRALAELLRCVDILEAGPFALMGMGRMGAVSRVLFAACGSCLNYGWLGSPQVPGQLPAEELAGVVKAVCGGIARGGLAKRGVRVRK